MHDAPRQKLRELIIEYGRSLCDDPRCCEALLKDYCGQYKREIFVLISALKNRVTDDLLKNSASVPQSILLARLNKRLEEELAMTAEAAQWAVESWALALGVITQPLLVIKPAPVSPSTPAKVAFVPPPRTTRVLLADRYQDNDDGTVTDVKTGLRWMRFSLGQEWKGGTCTGEARTYSWRDARDAAKTLNLQGGYAGYQDWRVPTIDELTSINPWSSPKINPRAFPNTPRCGYWSFSAYTCVPGHALYVYFSNGIVLPRTDDKMIPYHVRLVRGI